MTPELVTYILTVGLGIVVGLTLSAFRRSVYTKWLEHKLATARVELADLQQAKQQPWLTGATKEYHLQKRIAELKAENEALKGKDDGTEKCMNCASMVEQVWNAPDELWNTLSGYPQGNGVLCARCFDREAKKQGIFLYWSCQPDQFLHKENEALRYKAQQVVDGISGGEFDKFSGFDDYVVPYRLIDELDTLLTGAKP